MTQALFIGVALGGVAVAGLWTLRTLTSRAAIREHLHAARERRNAEVRAMTKGLAHELRNPLSTIGLNADLLTEAVRDLPGLTDDDRSPILRRAGAIHREAERLNGILDDFQAFAGDVRLNLQERDLNVVVDELVDFFAPQAAASSVRIRADLHHEPLIASVDADQLKQALLNLMLNATQAMTSSKPTSQDTQRPKELILRVRPDQNAGKTPAHCIHVIDTGPGIPDEVKARVFEPYFTTKPSGSGIGLAITKRLINEHQGELTVHSDPGPGTDFTVTLPAADNHPS